MKVGLDGHWRERRVRCNLDLVVVAVVAMLLHLFTLFVLWALDGVGVEFFRFDMQLGALYTVFMH